jgi:hypothetical protein
MNVDELEVTLTMLNITNFRFSGYLIIAFNDNNFKENNDIVINLLDGFYYERNPHNEKEIIVEI